MKPTSRRLHLESLEARIAPAAGDLDIAFGNQGIFKVNIQNAAAFETIVLPDGKFLAAGDCGVIGSRRFVMARYFAEGSLDTSFGNAGVVFADFQVDDVGSDIAVQADGKIVFVGHTRPNTNTGFQVAIAR